MLKAMREKKGLTQPALAELAGVPLTSLRNWEQGHRMPRVDTLPQLAKALGVPVGELVGGLVEEKLAGKKPGRKKPAPEPPAEAKPEKANKSARKPKGGK
jgi:transcriptional regulator with XRE-family HTH domain